jgi:hypothetical protein
LQIFNVTWEDEESGDWMMETGISAREYMMCDRDFRSKAITNMKQYEKVRRKEKEFTSHNKSWKYCERCY